ncbi:hypothetical protein lerEdw1_018857 [Lerista edwardsae]|nr:hypothetical protein lerEdw1_018857 [Lerista edwardsae]
MAGTGSVSGSARCGDTGEAAAFATPAFVAGPPCAFSPGERRLLALSGPDGRLRVWDTPSSRLQQEYVPSAHLSAACTCLAWAPPGAGGGRQSPSKEGPQRKKRKSEAIEASEQLDLLAIGTAVGSILLYSTIKGELQSKLNGHDSKVNCVRWHQDNGCLYSCSDDKHIVEWNAQTCKVKWQVRSDRKERNAVMTFSITDEPVHIDVTVSESKEEPLNTTESRICLVRDVRKTLALTTEMAVTKVKTPIVNSEVKMLVPGIPGHSATIKPSTCREKNETKRKPGDKEESIEDRLGAMDIDVRKVKPSTGGLPQTDNFAVLLVQGLESNDPEILNKVLQIKKDAEVKKTVARMPVHAVMPLLHESTTSEGTDNVSLSVGSPGNDFGSQTQSDFELLHAVLDMDAEVGINPISPKGCKVTLIESSEEGSDDEMAVEKDSDENWDEDDDDEGEENDEREELSDNEQEMAVEKEINGDSDLDPENESEEE